jgi:hypothetical protein
MSKNIKIITLLSMLLIGLPIYGTGQAMDNIIFQKQTYPMIGYPLLQYPNQITVNPDSMFKGQGCWNTGNYRRYLATWLIEDDSLFLLKIANDCIGLSQANPVEYADLSKLFPKEYVSDKVFADWFSGLIYCAYGKVIFWGNDIVSFEREIELNIQNGILIGKKDLDNTKSRQVNYEELFTSSYTRDDGFREHLDSLINWEILPPIPNGKARSTIRFSANEDGVLDDIKVVRGCGEIFDNEAVRIVKTLPANVQFYHGKLLRIYWTLPIVFNETTRLSKISKK